MEAEIARYLLKENLLNNISELKYIEGCHLLR